MALPIADNGKFRCILGLGPLFSHSNSSRTIRDTARKALTALGVTNLDNVVLAYINSMKEDAEPLENIRFGYGNKERVLIDNLNHQLDIRSIVSDKRNELGKGAFAVRGSFNLVVDVVKLTGLYHGRMFFERDGRGEILPV